MMLFIGLAIRLLVGMRQFNRRGVGGLQHFNNYGIDIQVYTALAYIWIILYFSWKLLLLIP